MTGHQNDPHYHPAMRPSRHHPKHWPPALQWAAAAIALVLVGVGGWAAVRALSAPRPTATAPREVGTVVAYFPAGERFERVSRPQYAGESEVQAAIKGLLEGPTSAEALDGMGTNIPYGTKLESVKVESSTPTGKQRAVIRVSDSFLGATSRNPDDATLESNARLDQVAYTMAQFPDITSTEVVAGDQTLKVPTVKELQKPTKQAPSLKPVVNTAASSGSATKAKAKSKPTISITQVQKRLVALKYLSAAAKTGKNDYATQQAVMAFQAWQGLQRDGSVGAKTMAALDTAKAPTPKSVSKTSGRYAQIFRDKGVALFVQDGELVRAVHVSTGKTGYATPAGTYAVYIKELKHWSTQYNCWLPYASFFHEGYAFHEYPEIPPYPGSHGCCRVPSPEAPWVYKFLAMGTPVYVY